LKSVKTGCLVIFAILSGLILLGSRLENSQPSADTLPELVSDAKAALRMDLENPEVSELHYFRETGIVCGLVNHRESAIGRAPFAYSHQLGLTVAPVWGKNEPEEINKRYGCNFLPIAYTNDWKSPFWGGDAGDFYEP